MKKELNIYICTSNTNLFIIKYFQYFWNKYYNNNCKVKILGFSKPRFKLAKNFQFISLAKEQANGAAGWSNYIIQYFSSIKDKFFIFGIDDFMITRPVDFKIINAAKILMKKHCIGRVDLQPVQYAKHRLMFKNFTKINGIEFKEIRKKFFWFKTYAATGAFSIWRKDFFLQSLAKNMSPWQWEINGTKRISSKKSKIVCSWNCSAIKKIELLSNKAWPGYINIKGIRKEDVLNMKKLRSKKDEVKIFKKISSNITGYAGFAGKNWISKVFGR